MAASISAVHIGFDMWTSPNNFAYLAATAHFLDIKGKQQTRLLAFTQQKDEHSGLNMSTTLHEVIQRYEIVGKVGVVVSDNASNNDTCISHLFARLDPSMEMHDHQARTSTSPSTTTTGTSTSGEGLMLLASFATSSSLSEHLLKGLNDSGKHRER
ncbi:putative AC9 transposase [Colletotrichum liriopes]|uniref:AC9 transposase n=1 Tax=Colletotrichum liriopes TaxID=708192 RepID=A0AA37GW56_9PEZI|nr:putative AC9 transposase [Colletotrichum liriopes]